MHKAVADFFGKEEDITVRTATLDELECGLPQEVIDDTDVLIWWGHVRHGDVPDEVKKRVQDAVLRGMECDAPITDEQDFIEKVKNNEMRIFMLIS